MNTPVTSVQQALGHFILDSDCPTVYVEVIRHPTWLDEIAPRWVALDLRGGTVGTMCGMRQAMSAWKLDEVAKDRSVRWGSSAEEAEPPMQRCRLVVERLGEGGMFYVSGDHADTGARVESLRLEIDQFLIDVANGRRHFGNMLTDADLEEEVAEDEAAATRTRTD